MSKQTQRYKRSFTGSVGSGMKSILGGNNRRYYVLEHKVSSKFHKAGESQKIIVDQIELGRDPKCQIRFDESFGTVSRRHAAIIKDADNWKLVQLSQTNSTYLNGRKIEKEWYLQSGDEIQLSTNGPKLGFIVPQGEKGLVKSIGMTARLNLFRQQALRPYKQALAALSFVFLLFACVGGYIMYGQSEKIKEYHTENIRIEQDMQEALATAEKERLKQDSINRIELENQKKKYQKEIATVKDEMGRAINNALKKAGGKTTGISALLQEQNILKDVFYIQTEKVVRIDNGTETVLTHPYYDRNGQPVHDENGNIKVVPYGWSGTGFLLNDGKLVTARHCVYGWLYMDFSDNISKTTEAVRAAAEKKTNIVAYFIAVSPSGKKLQFKSTDFKKDENKDKIIQVGVDENNGNPVLWQFPYPVPVEGVKWSDEIWATDWAYTTNTGGLRGNLQTDEILSRNLMVMQELIVCGYPKGLGVLDGKNMIEPIGVKCTASRNGLANNGCILHSRGTDHGNSGGPILALKDGKLVVVGIVSRGDEKTNEHNWAVPICSIK
ncbi:FHA domain-containing protein [Bacteroides sp. 519]|uniref:FHA domain-containing protein n=1 Tax=Bacteroides sp. 519 TaxID=2302937 RepID=UPI0013CFD2F0|nr:FHA domain-containing protein [Bacteroides sp. 519]NDV57871.1 FHA domain-containing protein [Bacteroides sp. 519]